jgi:hypothetical protein
MNQSRITQSRMHTITVQHNSKQDLEIESLGPSKATVDPGWDDVADFETVQAFHHEDPKEKQSGRFVSFAKRIKSASSAAKRSRDSTVFSCGPRRVSRFSVGTSRRLRKAFRKAQRSTVS